MKKILLTFFALFLFIPLASAKVNVYLFHSDSCPHCKREIEYLKTLDDVNVKYYEVSSYSNLLSKVRKELNIKESSVPLTIIGSDYVIGYSDEIKNNIDSMIESYSEKEHCDVVEDIIQNKDIKSCVDKNKGIYTKSDDKVLNIFGKKIIFNAKNISLPLISALIGFVDGFNPCAMWVLIFLISMLFNMKDRKKMWTLGIVFLVTSALVYMAFMTGILALANSSVGSLFKYVIALVALIGGTINLISFKKSLKNNTGCQVTDKKKKKKIMDRIKDIVSEKHFVISIIGIMLLAISVNLVELACSAGLPAMFIEILSLNNLSKLEYSLYMLIYMLMFMIDDIVVFIIAMTSLKLTGISNKYTKYSHLVGGIIMILIGILMIFKQDWLMFNF